MPRKRAVPVVLFEGELSLAWLPPYSEFVASVRARAANRVRRERDAVTLVDMLGLEDACGTR